MNKHLKSQYLQYKFNYLLSYLIQQIIGKYPLYSKPSIRF